MEKILLEALLHAHPDEIGPICRSLFMTGRTRAKAAALRHLERLDDSTRRQLARPQVMIAPAASVILAGNDLRAIKNLIELIELRLDASLAGELVSLMNRERGMFARPVARALLAITHGWMKRSPATEGYVLAMAQIDGAVARALHDYRHHRRHEVLITVALLSRNPGARLKRILEDEDDPVHFALRSVAEGVDQPLVRHYLLRWLDTPLMSRSVTRWLHKVSGEEAWAEVLDDAHLLCGPHRRRVLGQADKPMHCLPDIEETQGLPQHVQAWLAVLASSLKLSAVQKIRYLGALANLSEPRGRLRALIGLLEQQGGQATMRIRDFCADDEPTIARIAIRHVVVHRIDEHDAFLEHLGVGVNQRVAEQARWRLAQTDVGHFMRHCQELSESERLVAAHRLLATQRSGLLAALIEAMKDERREQVLAAIGLIRRLRLGSRCEASLIGLTFHTDPHLASAAVMALGESGSPRSIDALRAALRHTDARMQANAVEALMKRHTPETAELVAFLAGGRDNRSRANAIVALHHTQRPEGERYLRAMLRDDDPMHRVSALWAVRRVRAASLCKEVQAIALHDRLLPVRRRATDAVRTFRRIRMTSKMGEPTS